MATDNIDLSLCDRLVGFFDVLGQSSQLRHLTKLPDTEAERQELVRLLKRTVGAVLDVREMFKNFFDAAAAPGFLAQSLPDSARRQLLIDATRADVSYWGISDSFVVAVSLADMGVATTPVNGVYRALVAASGMWLVSLSLDHPLRGGIEVGLGVDIGGGEIYGPVLDRAHHLESKVAGGPRVVVGPICVDYLKYIHSRRTADPYQQIAGRLAGFCLSMLRYDFDGVIALDPLGDSMLQVAGTIERIGECVEAAQKAVRRQLMRAELLNDDKLIPRYTQLLAYLDERAGRWIATPLVASQ